MGTCLPVFNLRDSLLLTVFHTHFITSVRNPFPWDNEDGSQLPHLHQNSCADLNFKTQVFRDFRVQTWERFLFPEPNFSDFPRDFSCPKYRLHRAAKPTQVQKCLDAASTTLPPVPKRTIPKAGPAQETAMASPMKRKHHLRQKSPFSLRVEKVLTTFCCKESLTS